MDIGMLWFDNNPKSDLQAKVNKAVDYYQKKYGEEPNLCFVHPSMVSDESVKAGKVKLCTNHAMIPHHFWIGVQKQPTPTP